MEIEFKFCADAGHLPALRKAMGRRKPMRLQATYFDTADGRLAAAQAALRVRREGDHWIQTAKAIAQGPLVRLEDNVDLGPADGDAVPEPDWRRHLGTPVGERLTALLDADARLQPTYGTDIQRIAKRVRHADCEVELALDQGRIVALGEDGQPREMPVLELEAELLAGPLAGMAALAAEWVARHGLWIDTRSKAERGERLMRGEPGWPVARAQAMVRPADKTARDGRHLQALAIHNGLAHLLPNLQALAAGAGTAEHVHQARVALRRLRVVLREFAPLATPAWDADGAWQATLTQAFRRLGEVRDRQVLADLPAGLQQALAENGLAQPATPAEADDPAHAQLVAAARDGQLQQTLVALLAHAAQAPDDGEALRPKASREALQARVLGLHQRLAKAATRWAELGPDARHSVRKRAKRLRYLLELAAPTLAKSQERVQHYLKRLARVQEALGSYNDALLAQAQAEKRCADAAAASPVDWFMRGYWAAEVPRLAQACEAPLQRLRQQAPL